MTAGAVRYDDWMSPSDAVMWRIERDPILRTTITVVWSLDRRPDDDRFRESLRTTIAGVPRLRQRVQADPLDLAPPRWVDADTNLDDHLHTHVVDGPLGDDRIFELAGPIHSAPFDRDLPLWAMHLIESRDDERAMVVMKIHHTIADGIGLMKIAASMLDLERQGPDGAGSPAGDDGAAERDEEADGDHATVGHPLAGAAARRASADVELMGRAGGALLRNFSRLAIRPFSETQKSVDMARSIVHFLRPVSTPMSALTAPRSLDFALTFVERDFAAVRAAATAVGCSINDVFLAALVGGAQRYHDRHGVAMPDELRLSMPISVRPADDDTAGNQFLPARFLVPSGERDPRERIGQLRAVVAKERAEPSLPVFGEITEVVSRIGAQAATALLAGMMKACDITASNVPGVDVPLYWAGARIERIVACGPCAGSAVNVTLLSYDGRATLGLTTDRAAIPDEREFAACLEESLDEILALG